MQLFALTYEKIEELNEEYKNKREELEALEKKTTKEIWSEELSDFTIEYKKWHKQRNKDYLNEITSINTISTKKKKKVKKVSKKKKINVKTK